MEDDASDNDEDKVMKLMTVIQQHCMVIIRYQEILGGMAQGKLF